MPSKTKQAAYKWATHIALPLVNGHDDTVNCMQCISSDKEEALEHQAVEESRHHLLGGLP
jgi:hypothetical protein